MDPISQKQDEAVKKAAETPEVPGSVITPEMIAEIRKQAAAEAVKAMQAELEQARNETKAEKERADALARSRSREHSQTPEVLKMTRKEQLAALKAHKGLEFVVTTLEADGTRGTPVTYIAELKDGDENGTGEVRFSRRFFADTFATLQVANPDGTTTAKKVPVLLRGDFIAAVHNK